MSPILTRPVREQLEHDRVIRELQGRYKRKHDVIMNPGSELNQSVAVGDLVVYPDLMLVTDGGKKLVGTIEVETGESVNALEARAEWAVFCKLKLPLHLYVPPTAVDTARRLCAEYDIPIAELWTFHINYDQIRFTMIYRSPVASVVKGGAPVKLIPKVVVAPKPVVEEAPPVEKAPAPPVARPAAKVVAKPAAKPIVAKPIAAKPMQAKPVAKPAAKVKAPAKPVKKAMPAGKPAAKAKAKPVSKAKPIKAAKPAKKAPAKQAKPAKKRR